jgi:AraC family transcriptional regulator
MILYYEKAINRVLDYMEEHLDQSLSIEELAKISGFSTYHFHRIFKAVMGEALYGYLNRMRLEKAAFSLCHQKISVTALALKYGFYDGANFSKAFKKYFGMSPKAYQKSKICQDFKRKKSYNNIETNLHFEGSQVVSAPRKTFAYKRYIGPYQGNYKLFARLFHQVMTWVKDQELEVKEYLALYHDPMDITQADKLKVSLGVILEKEIESEEISWMTLGEGTYMVTSFSVMNHEYDQAWAITYKKYILEAGYQLRDGLAYETYPENCYDAKTKRTRVSIWVPIE